MSAHTPGPWGWTYDGSSDYSVGQADDPQAKRVCGVWGSNRHRETTERAMADCRLIAAAPDLLAALKYLLELGGDDDRRIAAEEAIRLAETGNHFNDDQ